MLLNFNIEEYLNFIINLVIKFSPNVITAFFLLFIGLWSISFITKAIKRIMIKRNIETTLSNFVGNLLFWILRVLLFVTVIAKLGFETSSFVAILGAAGLAIGLALQGSLSNFAGGILIILFKPFKVGDVIEGQGSLGTVKEIQIFYTILTAPDNKQVIIPNASLSNGTVINYTANGFRRVDLIISVAYHSDLQLVKNTLKNVLNSIPEILNEPAPVILVNELATSSIDFAVRPFAKTENYFKVKSDVLERCKIEFDKVGIEIPYPHQVEIHKEM